MVKHADRRRGLQGFSSIHRSTLSYLRCTAGKALDDEDDDCFWGLQGFSSIPSFLHGSFRPCLII
jgi:hypothetical protein